jgi:hypothetical protein
MLSTFIYTAVVSGTVLLVISAIYFVGPMLLKWLIARQIPGHFLVAACAAIGVIVFSRAYAIGLGFEYLHLRWMFGAVAIALAIGGCILIRRLPRPTHRSLIPLLPYAALWLLWCAIYSWRSVGPEISYLTLGNNDVWSYLKFANMAQLGDAADNIIGFSLRDTIANYQGQGSLFVLAAVMQIFGMDGEITFTIVVVILLTLMSWLTNRLCHKHLGLRAPAPLVISVTAGLSGITYLLVGFGFLNQLIGSVLCLAIFHVMLKQRNLLWTTVSASLLFYVLLLTYLTSLLIFLPLYFVVSILSSINFNLDARSVTPVWGIRRAVIVAAAPLLATAVLTITDFGMLERKIAESFRITDVVAGWPYGLLEPALTITAFMPPDGGAEVGKYQSWILLAAPSALMLACMFIRLWKMRTPSRFGEDLASVAAIFGAGCACIAIYLIYYLYRGESYQQWKVALTLLAPFGFVLIAAPFVMLRGFVANPENKWLACGGGALLITISAVSANVQQRHSRTTAADRFATYRALPALAAETEAEGPTVINVDVGDEYQAGMVLAAAIKTTPLRMYSPNYYRREGDAAPLERSEGVTILSQCWILDSAQRRMPNSGFCSTAQMRRGEGYELVFAPYMSGAVLGQGWSIPELWGRWTEGTVAELRIPVSEHWNNAVVKLNAGAMLACSTQQRVTLSANGTEVATWHIRGEDEFEARIPRDLFGAEEVVTLTFDLPDATAPASCGASNDVRELALGMQSLRVTPG